MSDYPEHFSVACGLVFEKEGGYVNDPRDPGGETNYGISKRAYPDVDIKNLTQMDAMAIYYRDYWIPSGCDKYPAPLAVTVFDAAVNQGVSQTVKMLQTSLRVTVDGVVGFGTVQAAAMMGKKALEEFTTARILHYASLPLFKTYGKGWVRRAVGVSLKAVTL